VPRKPSATQDALERIGLLRQRIAEFELIASGNLLRRTKVCGKPTCRCAQDERERHGPYWEWTRRERRRLVHRVVSSQEAARLAEAIRNGRAIRRLLARWERESIRIIDTQNDTR
jgi:hypothetical protein